MLLSDWTPPNCPTCHADAMVHKCISPVPGTAEFRKNGWYCDSCGVGPFQLGSATEADAARIALRFNNFGKRRQVTV